ncbi:hypothetical protein P879_05666 [Paragonimus westermani]|uniref:CID domain-containing protein n=1 Tax=Paragonimus westermani TaxID=34504 RepID=A0A8T0D320_9TREM|nr:hypothetical protein P879_05666 [Paragonimus westermani]
MDYSEDEAVKRLQQLDNSQSSVESTSQWFLAAKDMSKDAVKLWFKEFRKGNGLQTPIKHQLFSTTQEEDCFFTLGKRHNSEWDHNRATIRQIF